MKKIILWTFISLVTAIICIVSMSKMTFAWFNGSVESKVQTISVDF